MCYMHSFFSNALRVTKPAKCFFFLKNVAGSITYNAFEFSNALRVTEPAMTTFNGEKCHPPPSSAIKLSNFHSNMKLNIQYTLPLLQLIVLLKF